jgi:hypothetical protein
MKRNDSNPTCWKAGLLGGLLLALSPALAAAQVTAPVELEMQQPQPYATAVLYEVQEDIKCNPPNPDPLCLEETRRGFGTRIADAILKGGVDGFPGGVTGPPEFSGPILVDAKSIISKVDWNGPAHGGIVVYAPAGTANASFAGVLDLSMLAKQGIPLAPIRGKWHGLKGFKVGGNFTGMFEIPFQCDTSPTGICYLEDGKVVPAEIPLIKLVVTFYSK